MSVIQPRGCGNKIRLYISQYCPDGSGPNFPSFSPLSFTLKMSSFAAIATLLLFSGSAFAQVSAPNCAYPSLYDWVCNHGVSSRHFSTTNGLLQTYNSLNQSPCTVAAYLGSTCHGDCECSSCVYEHCRLTSCTQRIPFIPFPKIVCTIARQLSMPTRARATPFSIPLSVHVPIAREDFGARTCHRVFLKKIVASVIRWSQFTYNCTTKQPAVS